MIVSSVVLTSRVSAQENLPYAFHPLQIGGGGFITGVLFHPKMKDLVYIRTDIGGAYRWDVDRQRWTSLGGWVSMNDANLLGIESLAIDPAHPDDLYLAAGTYINARTPEGALLRSHDRGAHFEVILLPFKLGGNEPGRFAGERLALDGSGTMYLGTRKDGLWRSKDSGSTWHRLPGLSSAGAVGLGVMFVLPAAGNSTIFVGVADSVHSLFQSTDGGETWKPVPGAPKGLLPYRAAVGLDGALYVTYGNAAGPNGVTEGAVWKRDDRGRWKDISPIKPTPGAAGWGFAGLALDAQHNGTLMVSTLDRWQPGDTIFRSRDGGKHWKSLKERAVMDPSYSPFLRDEHDATSFGHWIAALGIDPFDSEHAIYGTGATLWESRDLKQADQDRSTHWIVDTRGIEETAVIDLEKQTRTPLFAGLGDIGCFRAERTVKGDVAEPFFGLRLSNCDSVAVATGNSSVIAAVGRTWSSPHHGGFSTDGGRHWTHFSAEPQGAETGGKVSISADGHAIFWTTHLGSFVTFDQGDAWSVVQLGAGLELRADPRNPSEARLLDTKSGELRQVRYSTPTTGTPQLELRELEHVLPSVHLSQSVSSAGVSWFWGGSGLFRMDPTTYAVHKIQEIQAAYALGFGKGEGSASTLFLAGQIAGKKSLYRSTDEGLHWVDLMGPAVGFGWITSLAGDPDVFGKVYVGTNGLGVMIGEPQPSLKPGS